MVMFSPLAKVEVPVPKIFKSPWATRVPEVVVAVLVPRFKLVLTINWEVEARVDTAK